MKKVIIYFSIAFVAGITTLGGYKLFFEKETNPMLINNSIENNTDIVKTHFIDGPNYAAETTDFTVAAAATVDAVVHVKNTAIYTAKDPFEQFFYGRSHQQVGTGSGVIISSDGYIITNNHVIDNASEIQITLNNQKVYTAELIGTDVNNDIALIKIDAEELPFIVFANSDNVKIGEWVLAVGNPYNLRSTVTAGIVSAKGRDLTGNRNIESYIQTDAAVNPGNSGGALVNTRGELVGINTAISSKTGSYIGYSFAVPSNIAKKSIEDLMEYGKVQRAYLGIQFKELNGQNASELGVDITEGVYVTKVIPEGAAAEAGVREKDIIIKINDSKISTFANLKGQLNAQRPGNNIAITVLRKGKVKELNVVLKNQFGNIKSTETEYIDNILGLELEELSDSIKATKNINYGVAIKSVTNKDFLRFGVGKNAILLKINKKQVHSVTEVEELLSLLQNEPYVTLQILTASNVVEYISLKL